MNHWNQIYYYIFFELNRWNPAGKEDRGPWDVPVWDAHCAHPQWPVPTCAAAATPTSTTPLPRRAPSNTPHPPPRGRADRARVSHRTAGHTHGHTQAQRERVAGGDTARSLPRAPPPGSAMSSEPIFRGHEQSLPTAGAPEHYTPKPPHKPLLARPLRYLLEEQRLLFALVGMWPSPRQSSSRPHRHPTREAQALTPPLVVVVCRVGSTSTAAGTTRTRRWAPRWARRSVAPARRGCGCLWASGDGAACAWW